MSQKKNPLFVWGWDSKNLSLAITVCHHSASLVMPIGDPWDGFFYPTLTIMIDSYIHILRWCHYILVDAHIPKSLSLSPMVCFNMRKPVYGVFDQIRHKPTAQLQRLVRILNFSCGKFDNYNFKIGDNKGTDQNAWKCRLVCVFVVHMHQSQVFPWQEPYINWAVSRDFQQCGFLTSVDSD